MKSFSIQNLALRFTAFAIASLVCALFAPWWGTPIVVCVSYIVFRLPTRTLSAVTFASWVLACLIRDTMGLFGPSRVFAKMLSIHSIGFPDGSLASRLCVYALAGLIGFLLALFAGGILKSLSAMLPNKLRSEKSLR